MELVQHQLLEERNLKRATKPLAWIRRFIDNNRVKEKFKTTVKKERTVNKRKNCCQLIKLSLN